MSVAPAGRSSRSLRTTTMAPRRADRASAWRLRSSIPAVDRRVAPGRDGLQRRHDALELLAPAPAANRRGALSSHEPQARGIAAGDGDVGERRGDEGRVRDLGAGRGGPAVPHRGGRVDEHAEGPVGLGLELTHDEAVVPEQRAPVEPAEVVAGDVLAEAPELDARPAKPAVVRARVDALGDERRAQAQRREAAPVDRALREERPASRPPSREAAPAAPPDRDPRFTAGPGSAAGARRRSCAPGRGCRARAPPR